MNARFVEDGEFRHSGELPEAPTQGQYVRIHDKVYRVSSVTWDMTPTALLRPRQAGVVVDVSEMIGNDRPLWMRKRTED